jgi:hypothetical protein
VILGMGGWGDGDATFSTSTTSASLHPLDVDTSPDQ